MTKKPTKSAPFDTVPLSKQASDIVADGLDGMRECISAVREYISNGDTDRGSELALLTHKAAQIMGEARKRENDEAKQDLSPAQLVEYFRNKCTDEQRSQWSRDILAMNRKGSVLG